jgi:hypothetical protein
MHPAFIDITDDAGARHLLRLERITLVNFAGSPEAPVSEVLVLGGGTLNFSAAETARLVHHLDTMEHILRPPAPKEVEE